MQTSCKHGKAHCAYFVKALRASPHWEVWLPGRGDNTKPVQPRMGPSHWCLWGEIPRQRHREAATGRLQLGPPPGPRELLPAEAAVLVPCPSNSSRRACAWPQPISMQWLSFHWESPESGSTAEVFRESHLASPQKATGTTEPFPRTTRGRARLSP